MPRTITLNLDADCGITDSLGNGQVRNVIVAKERITITVRLPEQTPDPGYDTEPVSKEIQRSRPPATLRLESARKRADYYQNLSRHSLHATGTMNADDKISLRKAMQWDREAIHESRRIGDQRTAKDFEMNLASAYDSLDEHGRAEAVRNGSDVP